MPPQKTGVYEFSLMVLLILFWGCIGLNRVGIGFIFPKIVPEFHMAYWQAGLLISGTSFTWAFSSYIGGWLSDNRGRRVVLLPAIGFTALMTAAMGATWNFLSMFIVRDLLGLGDGVGWSVGEATISEQMEEKRRGLYQALYAAGYSLVGVGLGALIVTTLTEHLGWRWVFPIVGAATALVFVALFAVLRESTTSRSEKEKHDWRAGLRLLRGRSMLFVTLMGCAVLAWLQLSIGFNVLFLTKVRGFTLVEAGSVMSGWGIVGTIGAVVLPFLSDYLGRRPVVLAASLLCALTLAAYLAGGFGLDAMRVLAAASGFFGFGLSPLVIATCVSEQVPVTMRGTAIGITNFFAVLLGTAVMPTVGGIVADHFGLGAALWIAVGMQIAIGVFVLAITETAPRIVARRAAIEAIVR